MRLAILSHGLSSAGGLSVGLNFVRELALLRREWEVLLSVPVGCGYETIPIPKTFRFVQPMTSDMLGRFLYDEIVLPLVIYRFRPDFILGLGNLGLIFPPCPQGILFHRPQWIYSNSHRRNERKSLIVISNFLKLRLRMCLPKTQIIFCQTETSRKRFRKIFAFKRKISLFPNAISGITTGSDALKKRLIFDMLPKDRFLFCLTRYYGHKNIELIVEAFEKYAEDLQGVRVLITISESQHPYAKKLLRRIELAGLSNRIINVGPLRQDELRQYFERCDGVLLPTMLESFSGTYLEAMHYGCPILTSDLDFAHEICGDAAIYFNPWSAVDLVNAIRKLFSREEIGRELAIRGRKRLPRFFMSWRDVTENVLIEVEEIVRSLRAITT